MQRWGKIRAIIDGNLFEKMGKQSLEIVRKRFTLEKMVSEYEELFSLDKPYKMPSRNSQIQIPL